MKSRGASTTFIVVMLILLIFGLGMLFFVKTVSEKTGVLVPEEKCRTTVAREAMLNRLFEAQRKPGHTAASFASHVECAQIPINLPGKDEGHIAGLTSAFMEKCWNTFGKGELLLFTNAGVFCHICYVLTVDSGVEIGLSQYLADRKGFLNGNYDVPERMIGEKQGVVFRYQRAATGADVKVFVRSIGQVVDVCAGASFPRARRT